MDDCTLSSDFRGDLSGREYLTDILFCERRNEGDIALVDKARSGIHVQTGEPVNLSQADLQDGQVALQPFLLVDYQGGPSALDGGHGSGAQVEAGDLDVTWLLVGRFQVRLGCCRQAAVICHNRLHIRVRGHVGGKGRCASIRIGVGGRVNFNVVYRQAGCLKGIDDALGARETISTF